MIKDRDVYVQTHVDEEMNGAFNEGVIAASCAVAPVIA